MKKSNPVEKIMHYMVHNSFFFTILTLFSVHAILLAVMLYSGVTPLVDFNILSVVVYFFCAVLGKFGHILPAYIGTYFEVLTYTIISVHYVGWDSASYFFMFAITPIILYFGCLLFKGNKRWFIVLMLFIEFSVYAALFLLYVGKKPLYEMSDMVRSSHVLFASFVMFFAIIFYNAIYIYSSEYEMNSLEHENEQLTLDATVDALTGLLNRRGFLPIVEGIMNKTDPENFCIAFCDIDNFKRINDSYGHDCGDEVLRHIARTLKRELPGCDVCRWGGEEMVVLMRDYGLAAASHKMEDVRKLIESSPTVFFNKRIPATITIGLEEHLKKYEKPEDIIKTADERMYYGKQHGKNILIFVDAE